MITEITVSNFRSLGENVCLKLGNLTALVGRNGAGKSNLADVFRFVSETLSVGLDAAIASRHGISALRRWSPGRPYNLEIQLKVKNNVFAGEFSFELAGDRSEDYRVKNEYACVLDLGGGFKTEYKRADGQWIEGPNDLRPRVTGQSLALTLVAGDERFMPLADALKNISVYSIFPDSLREPQKPDPVRPMKQHGENWASILKTLESSQKTSDLVAALGNLTGDISEFRVRQLGGYLNAEFLHDALRHSKKERQKWFESAQESDGTLRVAGIITALIQTPPLTLIGIEEPELTIHVGAIPLLYDYLKQASKSQQVLITTHSSELLNLLNIDDVRVVERQNGITTVARVCDEQRKSVKERLLSVGELNLMEGLKQESLNLEVCRDKES